MNASKYPRPPRTYAQCVAQAWKELARSERTMALVMGREYRELQAELLKVRKSVHGARLETHRWRERAEAAAYLAGLPPFLAGTCPHCQYVEGALGTPCIYHAIDVAELAAKPDPLEPVTRIRPRSKKDEK